jgi:hypothetical protein
MNNSAQASTLDTIRTKLKLKNYEEKARVFQKHSHVNNDILRNAFDIGKLREHSAKLLGAGALTTGLLVSSPNMHLLPPPHEIVQKMRTHSGHAAPVVAPQKVLIDSLREVLPDRPRPLTRQEEKSLEHVFSDVMKVPAKATLEGEHLNTTYGYIGAEQHLMRYPGDTMATHFAGEKSVDKDLHKEGMAPGRGAWGYFAQSKAQLTPDLVEKEKWYAVVQTLYLPDWNTRTRYLRDWYKHRKVVIVNTTNGQAVVAAIADSGPAAWTGKHFGGSPEVMLHLGGPRYKKGPVVLFFVDDPENKVPLGPVEYNKIDLPEWAFHQI